MSLSNGTQWLISTQDDFRRPILYGVLARFIKRRQRGAMLPIRASNKRGREISFLRPAAVTSQKSFLSTLVPSFTNRTCPSAACSFADPVQERCHGSKPTSPARPQGEVDDLLLGEA